MMDSNAGIVMMDYNDENKSEIVTTKFRSRSNGLFYLLRLKSFFFKFKNFF